MSRTPTGSRHEGRIQGSSMPWEPSTEDEAAELEERVGDQMDVILTPTPKGFWEVRKVKPGSGDRE